MHGLESRAPPTKVGGFHQVESFTQLVGFPQVQGFHQIECDYITRGRERIVLPELLARANELMGTMSVPIRS
jgi:hypothetical protein